MLQVFMAEQYEPVKRRVALKIIKTDTPSKEVLGRFEAERQALAMIDHQDIARVLDALYGLNWAIPRGSATLVSHHWL